MGDQPDDLLLKRWLHAHEEDTSTESVYRPANFAFKPSRGRRGFEFRPDHSCAYLGIAAQDGVAEQRCTWALEKAPELRAVLSFEGGRRDVLDIVSIDKDRLVIRK